jgi:hypothetical protein
MQHPCRLTSVLAAALTLVAAPGTRPPQTDFAAQTNYTQAERPHRAIRFIVVHVTEGSYLGTVAWLRDPRAHASANFVVGRDGKVQERVPLHDIAWHAGNRAYHVRSVGIENVRFKNDPAGFTLPEYRASAARSRDRAPVADPDRPASHHRSLQREGLGHVVRSRVQVVVANHVVSPAKVVASSFSDGQTVSGSQHWLVETSGTAARVEFVIDGKAQATATTAPYAYDWDTSLEAAGTHALAVRAIGPDGAVAEQTLTVMVAPPSAG